MKRNRKEKRAKQVAQAEKLVAKAADARGVSVEVVRGRLAELARVRAEMVARFEGTGTEVIDVRLTGEDQIEVVVRHPEVKRLPDNVLRSITAETAQKVALADRKISEAGRIRIAQIELEATFGQPRTMLPFMMGMK